MLDVLSFNPEGAPLTEYQDGPLPGEAALEHYRRQFNARAAYVREFGVTDKRPEVHTCDACGAEIPAGIPSTFFPFGRPGARWACADCSGIDLREAAVA